MEAKIAILAAASKVLYGSAGSIILSATIILACLTTAVGLLSANAAFFAKIFPKVKYQTFLIGFTLFSFAISNFGLERLIEISLPVLLIIYPIAIVLMLCALFGNLFNHARPVYISALIVTFLISLYDGLAYAGISPDFYYNIVSKMPLFTHSVGWLIPALVAGVIGYIIHLFTKK